MDVAPVVVAEEMAMQASSFEFSGAVAPPAAPMEVRQVEETVDYLLFVQDAFTKFSDVETYRPYFEEVSGKLEMILGEEYYALFCMLALPVTGFLVWTLVVYLVAYYRGRASKESLLVC